MTPRTLFLPCVGFVLVLAASAASSQGASRPSQFESFKGDGYYWYNVPPEEEQPQKKPQEKEVPSQSATPPSSGPKTFSTEWMRVNLPKLLDMAIDNPTKENVANYMYAQRVVLDKSQNFSERVKEVVATDPFLDENNRVPLAQFAQVEFTRQERRGRAEALDFIAKSAGIWVFIDKPEKCTACAAYVNDVLLSPVGGIKKEHGFSVRVVDVSTEAGINAARRLSLTVTPTTVLVIPPNGYYLVSQGLMSSERLHERIVIAAKTNGLLTPEQMVKINPYGKGVMSKADIDGFPITGNPSDAMSSLRKKINGEK